MQKLKLKKKIRHLSKDSGFVFDPVFLEQS
jgi:hypothetical protein